MRYLNLLLPLLAVLVTRGSSCDRRTNTGRVTGMLVESGNVEAYLGIPYAEPPVGPLRFAKPVSMSSWGDNMYDATKLPPSCRQVPLKDVPFAPEGDMSENCLFLNVWVPISDGDDKLKTIMLFFHGGGFLAGSSNMPIYDGAKLAAYGRVVVVTINYRVGGLGFLTDFTDDAPGSVGLYDQVMAIQWIKDNAEYFNGDPDNIVVFGESVGAYSVSFHQISPLSKNLIKRFILESGSSISPVYDDNNAELEKTNQEYAKLAGCKYDSTYIDCLRKLPEEKFSEIDFEVFLKNSKFQNLRVGNDFLPQSTIDAFQNGDFSHSEVLMGVNRNEGPLLLILQRPDLFGSFGEKVVDSMFDETTTPKYIRNMINLDSPKVDEIIRGYMNDVNSQANYTYLKAAGDAVGDYLIACANIYQAEYQSSRGIKVYFYFFTHRPTFSALAEWMGVAHQDEVDFVFGNPKYDFTEYEKELSKKIMNMWVTFAKTGNLTIDDWRYYTQDDPYLHVIGNSDNVGPSALHNRCQKWRDLFRSAKIP